MKGFFGGNSNDDNKEYRDYNNYNEFRNQNVFDDFDHIEKAFENLMFNGLFGIPRISGFPSYEGSGISSSIDELFDSNFDKNNFFSNNGFFLDSPNNQYINRKNIDISRPSNENIKYRDNKIYDV